MKALIISRDAQIYTEVAALGAGRTPPLHIVERQNSLREASEQLMPEAPELLILDANVVDNAHNGQMERLVRLYPDASLILLTSGEQQDLLMRAMRAGVREALPLPLDHTAFHEVLDRIALQSGVASVKDGKVFAFVSCKGGSGATFVATNFAYALAVLAGRKVLLIDLHGQFGDATLYVSDQKPSMTLSDLCAQISRMDGAFLESCLVQAAPGFGVLAAADDASDNIKPEHIDAIVRVARKHYDYIVLDVGRQIDSISLRALDSADTVYPVLQMALPDIRDGRRLLDIFRALGYASERTRLIVNRYEKGGKLRLRDLEMALGAEIAHTLPNDFMTVSDSVNQGVPVLRLARGSPIARALSDLVEVVTARRTPEGRTLFDRLFGRGEAEA